ncbi:hypothetical protein ABT095_22170 [Kitasatospora sp. NPDC002227]|uniref:hypothetical protein n=1 Tax=Kitasatospora sp. NPDC002227 TaxID=3154773 RepID=UPI00331C9613
MENTTAVLDNATTAAAFDSRTHAVFAAAKQSLKIYAGFGVAGILVVLAVALSGQTVIPFMWVRAALLPVVALILLRMVGKAEAGSRQSYDRIAKLTLVMPIAIVGVDLIPGVCPLWFAGLQAVCVLPVVRVAILAHGAVLKAAFPKAA